MSAPYILQKLLETYNTTREGDGAKSPQVPLKPAPFLSIITRTRGSRNETLRDTLMSLAGQTCLDFELIIVVHSDSAPLVDSVRGLVAEFPSTMCEQTRIIVCSRPGRAAPLNDGVASSKGHYIAVLDDDDFVFAHYVETFSTLARQTPGALLRATCTRQDFDMTAAGSFPTHPRAISWFSMPWPATYDAILHVVENQTPFMSVAFPAEVFSADGLCFDESLTTAEDWELTTRAAMLRGVVSTPEITSVYRWWVNGASSQTEHQPDEWKANADKIRQKLDAQPLLLPPGSARRIAQLIEGNRSINVQRLSAGISLSEDDDDPYLNESAYQLLVGLLNSLSWRWTRPVRQLIRLLTGRSGIGLTIDQIPSSLSERQEQINKIRSSYFWRIALPLRLIGTSLRRARIWSSER
jgi:glycosyltransferase involved in cell wall biosynthesis